jgi:hypothetical protein
MYSFAFVAGIVFFQDGHFLLLFFSIAFYQNDLGDCVLPPNYHYRSRQGQDGVNAQNFAWVIENSSP